MTKRERTDLKKAMAERARILQRKLEQLRDEDLTQWLEHIEALKMEGVMLPDELKWLDRVHTNMLRRILPTLDNLDQVRWTLDQERGGESVVEKAPS